VKVDLVEEAILRETVDLLSSPPSVETAVAALRDELTALEQQIAAVIDEREEIGRSRMGRRSLLPVQRQREAELFQAQQALEDRQKAVQDTLAATGSKVVDARVARLWDSLEALEGDDRTEANAAMRETFSRVVVDHNAEVLDFHWRHGGTTRIAYGLPFGPEDAPA